MQKLFRSLIAIGGLAGLAACGDDITVAPPPDPAFAVSGAPTGSVAVGARVQLSANRAATWASSNATVASVDGTGLVTANAAGTASITATSTANVNDRATVTITVSAAPGVRSVTVSPANAVLVPGQTTGFVANVVVDPGVTAPAVVWTSSNTAVATVNQSGAVTAVSVGATRIIATAGGMTGEAAVTVRSPTPATISIQNITVTGTPGNTVQPNNIVGSIDVNMNVDPGEQVITRVEVILDGNTASPACAQNLSFAQSEAARVAAAFDEVEEVIISCTINTSAFNGTTGVVNFFNGAHTISARAILVGGTDIATPSTSLFFNNQSGVIAVVTNNNGTDPATAIDPRTGLAWIGGSVTVNMVAVSYAQGTSIAFVGCTIFGKNVGFTVTNNLSSGTFAEGTTWSAGNLGIGNYMTPLGSIATGESITCPAATLSNGQPLAPPVSGSLLLNFGPNPGQQTNASNPPLQFVRVDNTSPGATSANGVVQTVVSTLLVAMANPWVNATSALLPTATGGTNVLGIPSLATLNALSGGVDVEEGVDAITVAVWVPAAGGTLTGSAAACSLTGLTSVTTGNQLAEVTVSTAYPVRVVFTDALGNRVCVDLVQSIGADFTAPTGTITGPVANTGYNAALPPWAATASDNASGFAANPLLVTMTRLNANNTTTCVIGAGSGCTAVAQPLTFSATGGSATEGYYTVTITLSDAAGNTTTLVTNQLNLFDVTNPAFTGGISLPALISGATTNTFVSTIGDNMDLGSIFGVVRYPAATGPGLAAPVMLQYPTQVVGTFGPPLEQSQVNYAINVANWIRCLNAAGSFAAAANQPDQITFSLTDQTTIPGTNTATLASPVFGSNAQVCTGTVGNVALNSFVHNAPTFAGTATQVDLDGASMAAASASTVTLTAVADVPLNTSSDPFSSVEFFYQNAAGNVVRIGQGSAVLAQTLTNRTYTYSIVWDPAAPVQTGVVTVVAIGRDAQGDAVMTNTQTVTIVP